MASPIYNNATLAAQEKKRRFTVDTQRPDVSPIEDAGLRNPNAQPGDPGFDWDQYDPNTRSNLLGAAKEFLARPDPTVDPDADDQQHEQDLAAMDAAQPKGFLVERGSVMDSPMTKLARLGRQIVRPIPQAIQGAAGVGAMFPGPVGDASRMVVGAGSAKNLYEGGTEGLTEHPFRSALDAGGVALGASGVRGSLAALKGLFKERAAVSEAANLMKERVAGTRADQATGFSPRVASRLNDMPQSRAVPGVGSPRAEVVSPGSLFGYQSDQVQEALRGLRAARKGPVAPDLMDEYLASTAGPAKDFTMGGTRYSANAGGSHVAVPDSPIARFYAKDPAARFGGEGRMTGQFSEGEGGLSDIAAGRTGRPPTKPTTPTKPSLSGPDGSTITEADAIELNAELQALGRQSMSARPRGAEPLLYTKSGYLQRPGEPRVHRRGWNASQVEAARQRALKGLDAANATPPLTAAQKLAARSVERFGKRYRKE